MRHQRYRAFCGILALATLPACDLSTEPPPPPPDIDLSIDFCADDIPLWIAYQQDGQNWVRLQPNADGTVAFTAKYKLAFATVHQNGSDTRTEVIYTTNTVLAGLSGRLCREESGSKTLNGTVTGFSGTQRALVSMGVSGVYRMPGQNTFTLANLPTRPLDIMASRMNFVGATEQRANRTILRRSQNLVSGSSIAPLDFDASEALMLSTANLAVSGLSLNDQAFLANNFFSQLETSHLLTFLDDIGNGNHSVEALPNAASAQGDYHDAFVTAVSAAGHVRGVERFFRSPGSQEFVIGPELSAPIVAGLATSPYLRLRTILPFQDQYPSAASVEFDQQLQFSANKFIVTVTLGYIGVSRIPQWELLMDDMSGAPGWQNSWGLQTGDYTYTVTAYGARGELLFGASPIEGELVQFGIRFSDPTTMSRRYTAPPRPLAPALRVRR